MTEEEVSKVEDGLVFEGFVYAGLKLNAVEDREAVEFLEDKGDVVMGVWMRRHC